MTHTPRILFPTAAALLLTLAAAAQAHAGCTVGSSRLAFGHYQPLTFAGKLASMAVTSTATVSVTCDQKNGLAGYTLTLGPSPMGGGIGTRYLVNERGGNPMLFNVDTDPTYLTVWGDGSAGSAITHGALDGTFQHTVYGQIPGRPEHAQGGQLLQCVDGGDDLPPLMGAAGAQLAIEPKTACRPTRRPLCRSAPAGPAALGCA
jgi:spore coat protein U-like protein